MSERHLISSLQTIKDFRTSTVWLDMLAIIQENLDDNRQLAVGGDPEDKMSFEQNAYYRKGFDAAMSGLLILPECIEDDLKILQEERDDDLESTDKLTLADV